LARRFIASLQTSLHYTQLSNSLIIPLSCVPIYYPLNAIIIKRELLHPSITPYGGMLPSIMRIYKAQGFTGIYSGISTCIILDISADAIARFIGLKVLHYLRGKSEPTTMHRVVANTVGSITSTICTTPLVMAAMIEIYSEPVAGYPFVLEFNILHKLITKHSLLGLYKTPLFIFNLFADTADTITTEFCSDNYSRWPIWFAHLILREFVSIPFKRQFVKKLGYYTGNTTRTLIQEIKKLLDRL